jgi:hypothetical protein
MPSLGVEHCDPCGPREKWREWRGSNPQCNSGKRSVPEQLRDFIGNRSKRKTRHAKAECVRGVCAVEALPPSFSK